MFVFGNFLSAVAQVLDVILTVLYWMIIIRVVASWLSADPYNPIVVFLHRFTEPVLAPFRRLLPPLGIGFDLSPILAILSLMFIKAFLIKSLIDLSYRLQ